MKNLKLIFKAFFDLLIRLSPQIKKKTGFVFLVHPRNTGDIKQKYPFLNNFSDEIIEKMMLFFWPVTVSKIQGVQQKNTGENLTGWVIACPLTAKQMMNNRKLAKKFILKTAKLAEKKGAKIIGLGALTASLTKGGIDLENHIECEIVTGKIFTANNVVNTVVKIVDRLSLNKNNLQISIVGAAGSIGSASAQILVKKGFKKINLIDLSDKSQKINFLIKMLGEFKSDINITQEINLNNLNKSDIIIAVTNRPDALISSKHLKPGAIVVDDAQPTDVEIGVIKNRKDILILEGGAVSSEQIECNFNFGLRNKGDIFSCLAELIIMAYSDNEIKYNLGEVTKLDFKILDKMNKLSNEIGFETANFQNMFKNYSEEDLDSIKQIINNEL